MYKKIAFLFVFGSILLSACGATATTAAPPATKAPSTEVSNAPQPTTEPTVNAAAALPNCGTDPIVLKASFETGFPITTKLAEEFTKQFPNVTWDISYDQFANLITTTPLLLSSDNPPDLLRLPTMVSFAKDGLLKNLDNYASVFGWDKWPVPQLNQNRVSADGIRGSGPLYAMGLNYSLTGIFYNKKLAAQIGMTAAPKTVAELEDLFAKANAAGLQPIMEWGSAKSGMGLAFPLQNLMAAYGPVKPINDWIFGVPGATIDTPTNLTAAQHLEQWIKAGYFPPDINAIEYGDAADRFGKGEGVFTFNGDWQRRLRCGHARQCRVLPDAARCGGRRICRHVRPADVRHRRQGQARGLRRVLLQLGRHERRGPPDQRHHRRLEPRRTGGCQDAGRCRRLGHQRDACRRTGHGRGGRRDGLHRQCDELDLRPGLDARAPEDGRRQAGCRRAPQSCSSRVPARTGSVIRR